MKAHKYEPEIYSFKACKDDFCIEIAGKSADIAIITVFAFVLIASCK